MAYLQVPLRIKVKRGTKKCEMRPRFCGSSLGLCKSAGDVATSRSGLLASRPLRQAAIFMKPDVEIYDTTLRDGSQGQGVNFSVMDKLRIAERLDAFGVHFIEGGWPGSNPKDIEFFDLAKRKTFKRARLAAFGSTRRKGLAVADG